VERLLARLPSGEAAGGGGLVARGGASVRRGAEKLAQQADGWKRSLAQKLQRPDRAPAPASARRDGQGDGRAAGDGAAAPQAEMTREQALRTLGLEPGASAGEIEAAYRARTRQNGSLNGSEKLSRARDVLRSGEGS
jgi:hypothetical protein